MKKAQVVITKKMTIREILEKHPEIFEVFANYGLYCISCPVAQFETVEEMAKVYGFNLEDFLADLNKAIKNDG